uniref:Uncharacterized protein n=1 Tax=Kalanchoe fedtschenkoi TaxID=63787 RepID=A0A7N0T5Z9_KALFE
MISRCQIRRFWHMEISPPAFGADFGCGVEDRGKGSGGDKGAGGGVSYSEEVACESQESKANALTEGRKNEFFNHLKAASDTQSALAWIAYSGKDCGMSISMAQVEESWQSAEFYNKNFLLSSEGKTPTMWSGPGRSRNSIH